MNDGGPISPEFQATGLGFLDDARQVAGGNQGARARVGHQSATSQHSTQSADLGHDLRYRQSHVELDPAAFNLRDQVVVANVVCAGLAGDIGGFAVGEHQNAHLLAQTVGQDGDAANLLFGVAHVSVGAEMHLHGFVELGGGEFLHQVDGLSRLVNAVLRNTLGNGGVASAVLGHYRFSLVALLGTERR